MISLSIKPLVFSGSDYEIGFQQGESCRGSIQQAVKEVFGVKEVLQNKPAFLPKSFFEVFAKRRADKMLRRDLFHQYPKHADRIRGIADAAGVEVSSLLFIQMLEMVIAACTSLGFFSEATSVNQTILAKNFDYANFAKPYSLVCRTKPSNGYETLCCRLTPLSGSLDGMNEHGLCVTYNLARSVDKSEFHIPTSVIMQEMLETCKSTRESVDFLNKVKKGGRDGIITLADPTNDIATVELSSQHMQLCEPQSEIVINTNHYQSAEMKLVEKTPVYYNSPARFERARKLLQNRTNIDEGIIKAVLRDHGSDNIAGDTTICMHGELFGTGRSMIMYPKKGAMVLLFGHPCQNEYQEIMFS